MSRKLYGLIGVTLFGFLLLISTYGSTSVSLFTYTSTTTTTLNIKKDYTDLIYATRNLFYGPWRASIPQTVVAGEEFEMTFFCTHPDPKLCPTYYMVQFRGPTIQAVSPDAFSPLNWTNNVPYEYAYLTAKYTIRDPGQYQIYVYPELWHCSQWNKLEYPWQRATVDGTPFDLVVTGEPPEEGFGPCETEEQIYDGRYVAIASASSRMKEMFGRSGRAHVYAPYSCKIPARTIKDALDELPNAKQILWAGDSVTRNPFCRRIWWTVHHTVKDSPCDPDPDSFHYSHKITDYKVGNRSVGLSFLWSPHWPDFERNNINLALSLNPAPTHVVFNFGLWIPNDNIESLQNHFSRTLEFFAERVPSVEHIVIKTHSSVVQTVDCRGKDWKPNEHKPSDSLDFRYGGNIKRHGIIELAKRWNDEHPEGFRVSVVDAWLLTDSRPETTSDGRHYSSPEESPWYLPQRPLMGEADAAVDDVIFDEFITGRVAGGLSEEIPNMHL